MPIIKTPSNQQRHTNIAIIKYKVGKKKFEIAAYKEKILDYRKGLEKDIDNVLQTEYVFTKISEGAQANKKDLLKAFDTTDQKKICELILKQGNIQISPKEREQMYDNLRKDVVYYICSQCINTQTNRPYPPGMIEREMKKNHFHIKINKSAKVQAIELIKLLASYLPIVRSRMSLRLEFKEGCEQQPTTEPIESSTLPSPKSLPSSISNFILTVFQKYLDEGDIEVSKYQFVEILNVPPSGDGNDAFALDDGFSDDDEEEDNSPVIDLSAPDVSSDFPTGNSTFHVYVLADPGVFRELDEYMDSNKLGLVSILETSVQHTGDVGIDKIQVDVDDIVHLQQDDDHEDENVSVLEKKSVEKSKSPVKETPSNEPPSFSSDEEELAYLMGKPKKSLSKHEKRRLRKLRQSLL